jgi:hypothetical protein
MYYGDVCYAPSAEFSRTQSFTVRAPSIKISRAPYIAVFYQHAFVIVGLLHL